MSGNPTAGNVGNADPDHPKIKDGPWNGFLSLAATHINWIGRDKSFWSATTTFTGFRKTSERPCRRKSEAYGQELAASPRKGQAPRGYREYELSKSGTIDGGNNGDYIVTIDVTKERTVLQIPCLHPEHCSW